MSLYSENYKKMTDGYNKIVKTIKTLEFSEQFECVSNMINSWLSLVDCYCDEVFNDKSNRCRRKEANHLGETCAQMFESLKSECEQKSSEFNYPEYEGNFKPLRIKGFNEMNNEYEYE